MSFEIKNKSRYIQIACFLCLFGFFIFLMMHGMRKYADEMEQKRRLAVQKSKETSKYLKEKIKTCRAPWEGKDRVPIVGGGWVDIKKIPYEFIRMQEDVDGICRATGIMESSFYWDGENIIPEHAAFSGVSLGTFGGFYVNYIPMYIPEWWVHFSITATFRNQREFAACKEKGEGYVSTMWGGCLEKCKQGNGLYVVNKTGKCIINVEMLPIKPPSSRIVQSNVYRDLVMVLDREDYPHFTTYGRRFLFKEWPYKEKFPFIDVGGTEFSHRTFNLTKEQLESMNIGKITFSFYDIGSVSERFYFEGGKAMARTGKMSLHDAFSFSKKLYEYLSNVVIKEYEL